MPSKKYIIIAVILIVILAVFFRFWQFSSIPAGLYQDDAMNGADALTSLETGEFKTFYPNNNGREGLIIWLDAVAIKLFGTMPWVLRLFPAIAGVLAVLGLYFLTKELFSVEIALASSFFMATSFWAVNFSRMGFRAGLMVPILIWSFYFLYRGLNQNNRCRKPIICFVLGGILFGLGFYTYISFRFAPVLALLAFGPFLFKKNYEQFRIGVLAFAGAAFLVALPIGLYFLHNPTDFVGRSSEVSIFSKSSPVKALAVGVAKVLGMFNIAGDFNWRHNYAGSPELFWPVGILFLLGIGVSIKRFAFEERFMFIWLIIFLLPNILTFEGNPHALRAIGAMPIAMIFSGIGLVWLYRKAQKYFDGKIKNPDFENYKAQFLRLKKEFFLLVMVFLLFVGAYNFSEYFNMWSFNPNTLSAFSHDQVEISQYLNSLPSQTEKYVLWHPEDRPTDNGLPVSAQTIYFLTSQKTKINYLRSNELNKISLGKNGAVIAPNYFNLDLLHNLNKQFPNSAIKFIYQNKVLLI